MIAEKADANISMIRYYFGNKEGLYEEMIRETLNPLLNVLDGQMFMATRGRERTLSEWVNLFYQSGLTLEELAGFQSLGKILVLRPKG